MKRLREAANLEAADNVSASDMDAHGARYHLRFYGRAGSAHSVMPLRSKVTTTIAQMRNLMEDLYLFFWNTPRTELSVRLRVAFVRSSATKANLISPLDLIIASNGRANSP
jgi:hypothetical protein